MKLILIGIIINTVSLLSIFDIYFKSPIIHGVSPYKSDRIAPAKRVVLFVADGLRAESLYGFNYTKVEGIKKLTPYLSSVISNNGSWGVSHTRVPTESRPGHVALAAGFYEDPSAIARGWRENPVEFDSVFNQSKLTLAWGSPDIVTMFSKVSSNHVFSYSYSSEEEDFSGKQSTILLDKWVFDQVENYFKNAQIQNDLREQLNEEQVILFLHLLGLDTAGHTHKPHSKEYFENIYAVDQGIKKIVQIVEDFYKDNQTAYVFTADHGMTDWGSHGAGSSSETVTPFISWGAGLAHSEKPIEIAQADIAPLISTLIGTSIPVNSLGTLPIECLKMSIEDRVYAIYTNAKQISILYESKKSRTEENSIRWLYKPFEKLDRHKLDEEFQLIERLIRAKEFSDVIEQCQNLIKLCKEGLQYYQNYYQNILLLCISVTYAGWIVMLFIELFQDDDKQSEQMNVLVRKTTSNLLNTLFALSIFLVSSAVYVQKLPFMYYIYTTLPLCLWWYINKRFCIFLSVLKTSSLKKFMKIFGYAILYCAGIEILVISFFYREILSVPLLAISVWPFLLRSDRSTIVMKSSWTCTCIFLSIFPFLPVVGSSFNLYLMKFLILLFREFSGCLWMVIYVIIILSNTNTATKKRNFSTWFPVALIGLVLLSTYQNNNHFQNKYGLQLFNQIVSWFILSASFLCPLFGSFSIPVKLSVLTLYFSGPFILLSVTYEPLFLLTLFLNQYFWLTIEHKFFSPTCTKLSSLVFRPPSRQKNILITDRAIINKEDFRRAYFFLLYSILAFFGTGNMASVNSFDPMWVRNFVTVFSPFTMMFLLLFKILIPYLIISCFFRAVTVCLQAPVVKLFRIVLIYCALMGLHFLHLVKNQGSWLEIGTSLSHFIIIQAVVIFLLILYYIAIYLTEFNVYKFVSSRRKNVGKDM